MPTDQNEQREAQRMIEILIGPCTRDAAEEAAMFLQEAVDTEFASLGAAVSVDFAPDPASPTAEAEGPEPATGQSFPIDPGPEPSEAEVEAAAKAMCDHDESALSPQRRRDWEMLDSNEKDAYCSDARTALAAAPVAPREDDGERIARDFLNAVAAPAGRLSLKNPRPTSFEVGRDADLIVRTCRTARDALDGTPFAPVASREADGPELSCPTCGYRCRWPICTKCGRPTPRGPWSFGPVASREGESG